MFKRILTSLLFLALVATVAPSIDQASASGKTYVVKVNSGKLNVRKKPSASGVIVTKLSKGQAVTVSSQTKGWAKISVKGKKGYVSSKYIAPKSSKKTTFKKASVTAVGDYKAKAISVAKSNMGVKYKWAGNNPNGFDCSGLVSYSFSKAGVDLPRTAGEMYNVGTKVTSYQPGDLLFFATSGGRKVTHVAIYIGNGQMIHSATSKGVSIASINNPYWKPRFIGAKRI